MQSSLRRQVSADLVLLAVTAIWGVTFVLVKRAVVTTAPATFLSLRFVLAAALLWPLALRHPNGRRAWVAGLATGVPLWGGYLCQTLGLTRAGATEAAFLTGLSVVLVPLLWALRRRRWPVPGTWLAVGASLLGLVLLGAPGGLRLDIGEIWLLGAAVGFALQVVAVAEWAGDVVPAQLAATQVSVAAMLSAVWATATGWGHWPGPEGWWAVAITGVLASAGALLAQATVQAWTPPEHTALIFAAEPAFAALFARWSLGEHLAAVQWVGAALMFSAMLLAERTPGTAPGRGAVRPARGNAGEGG